MSDHVSAVYSVVVAVDVVMKRTDHQRREEPIVIDRICLFGGFGNNAVRLVATWGESFRKYAVHSV